MFKELSLEVAKLNPPDYEWTKDLDFKPSISGTGREDLSSFIAIGQEYLSRTGVEKLPEELRLSNFTLDRKILYGVMKKYVDQIESQQPAKKLTRLIQDGAQKGQTATSHGKLKELVSAGSDKGKDLKLPTTKTSVLSVEKVVTVKYAQQQMKDN